MSTSCTVIVLINQNFAILQKCDVDVDPQFLVPPGTKPSLTSNGSNPHESATKGTHFGFQTSAPLSAIDRNLRSSTDRFSNQNLPVIDPTLVSPIHNSRSNGAKAQPGISCPVSPDLSHNNYTDENRSQCGSNESVMDNGYASDNMSV